jgi:hypothetical protein
MKKQSIFVIGVVVVVISCLSEGALSLMEHEQWSNYALTWETKLTSINDKNIKRPIPEITVCSDKLAQGTRNLNESRQFPLATSKR